MADDFSGIGSNLDSPGFNAAEVTPNDSADLTNHARALWVGGNGDVKITTAGGDAVTIVGAYGIIPIRTARVWSTGTSATSILAIW